MPIISYITQKSFHKLVGDGSYSSSSFPNVAGLGRSFTFKESLLYRHFLTCQRPGHSVPWQCLQFKMRTHWVISHIGEWNRLQSRDRHNLPSLTVILKIRVTNNFQRRWLRWPRRSSQKFAWMFRSVSACFSIHPIFWQCVRYVHIGNLPCSNQWTWSIIKTCKALQAATRKRVVWVDALHRVCFDNALFLPSFPISEMSDRELEKAAMAPRRWVELYSAFKEQHLYDHAAMLHPRGTRYINDLLAISSTETFIVPGGRYLVTSSCYTISVLDLGYTSSADCKLIASVRLDGGDSKTHHLAVQATLDGMGLVIFTSNR